jgi:prepilin-type processing-associated H-X9-DG protein
LLIAVLLPALAGARASARNIVCKNQMRQLALAARLYDQENGVMFIHSTGNSDPDGLPKNYKWWSWIQTYIPEQNGVVSFRCPDFVMPTGTAANNEKYYTGYHANGNMASPWWSSSRQWRPIDRIVSPSLSPCFWDDKQTKNRDGGWPHSVPSVSPGSWYVLSFRHPSQSLNLAMFDGSVRLIKQMDQNNSLDYPEINWDLKSIN